MPKSRREPHKLRFITNQSFPNGASVNDSIPLSDRRVHYDTLQHLAIIIRFLHYTGIDLSSLILWKSDIKGAFRLLPVHPLWQLRQLVEVDGQYYYDRCVVFGGGTSPRAWCAVAALVAWIAFSRFSVFPALHYVDDYFGLSIPDATGGKPPQQASISSDVPVSDQKNEHGRQIEITGILYAGHREGTSLWPA